MDPPEIFEAFARELPWLMDATKNHAQVKVMINQLKATSLLLVISIIASGSSLARMRGQNQGLPAETGKMARKPQRALDATASRKRGKVERDHQQPLHVRCGGLSIMAATISAIASTWSEVRSW